MILCGCSDSPSSHIDNKNIKANADPPAITDEDRSLNEVLQIDEDSSYDGLYAESHSPVYKLDDEFISCKIINKHFGKGFYFYEIPFIEKKVDGNWIRLFNNSDRIDNAEWFFCGVQDKKDISYTADVRIKLDDVEPEVDQGDYRFVIFTAENVLYADFKLEK